MNIERLLNSKHVVVEIKDPQVDGQYVKNFRKHYGLTQVALANILGVDKKTIEKWEQGKNKIKGCSALLLALLMEDSELFHKVYNVKIEEGIEDLYKERSVEMLSKEFTICDQQDGIYSVCTTKRKFAMEA